MNTSFDKYAECYDSWFIANPNILLSELRLVAAVLEGGKKILSVGCGSGLFEFMLARDFGIGVTDGIEPAAPMAEIARKRGMTVTVTTAEDADFGHEIYDTIIFNGSPGYITDLEKVIRKAWSALPAGGRLILVDVPKESGFGTLYNLAATLGTWEHPLLEGVAPKIPYPIEFVRSAHWRTTAEKIALMRDNGFSDLTFMQTLISHPLNADDEAQTPVTGFGKGDYVAITGYKTSRS